MPNERTWALLGPPLIELAWDRSLQLDVKSNAAFITRQFPTIEDVSIMAQCQHPFEFGPMRESPDKVNPEIEAGRFGPVVTPLDLRCKKGLELGRSFS